MKYVFALHNKFTNSPLGKNPLFTCFDISNTFLMTCIKYKRYNVCMCGCKWNQAHVIQFIIRDKISYYHYKSCKWVNAKNEFYLIFKYIIRKKSHMIMMECFISRRRTNSFHLLNNTINIFWHRGLRCSNQWYVARGPILARQQTTSDHRYLLWLRRPQS